MALNRYAQDPILGFGTHFGTARALNAIRNGIKNGSIAFKIDMVRGNDRLDVVAGREYGDGSLWWVIAAASDVGWMFQVVPGTKIVIPKIEDVLSSIG